jgi:hypothetical protein
VEVARGVEVGAKAWTMTSVDAVSSLEASFPTSPSAVLDGAGENLPLAGYIVGAFSIVSSLEALLGVPVPRRLANGGVPSCGRRVFSVLIS